MKRAAKKLGYGLAALAFVVTGIGGSVVGGYIYYAVMVAGGSW